MKSIEVFEPALCCSTGVCGSNPAQELITFSADLEWTRKHGGNITRYNLANEPTVFAQKEAVLAFLQVSGSENLPLVLVDGVTVLAGRYPSRDQLAKWAGLAAAPTGLIMLPLATQPASCCEGSDCC